MMPSKVSEMILDLG